MKKLLAIMLTVALMITACAVCVNAAEGEFTPFGTVETFYDKNASTKITFDGDIADWAAAKYSHYELDKYNFDPWSGEVPDDFKIDLYYTADANYLYVAFNVHDNSVVACSDGAYNDGDAFQIQLDFNGSAAATEAFERSVFYSFGYQEDGAIDITVQCINDDAASGTDYTYSSEDDEWEFDKDGIQSVKNPILGKCAKTTDGWCAEFALAWQVLYGCAVEKLDSNENCDKITFQFDKDHPISLPMLICYLDRDENEEGGTDLTMAAGTSYAEGALSGGDGWAGENAGAVLVVKIDDEEGKLEVQTHPETEYEETTVAETTVAEATTAAEKATSAEATTVAEAATTAAAKEESTTAAAEKKSGCGSVIGGFAVLAVVSLAGVSLKKKH